MIDFYPNDSTSSMSTAQAAATVLPQKSAFSFLPWIAVTANVLLVAALFGSTFVTLHGLWERDSNYSHGYLVGPISLALAVWVYSKVGPPIRGESLLGFSGIILGILCQLSATVVRWPPLSYLGLICVLRGLLVCAGGRTWARAFTFPLLFLFFMFPVPVSWTGYAALWLQDIVSRISEKVISQLVVCQRVGHSIRIAGMDDSIVVAAECSGLGQIVAFLAFAAFLGFLLSRPMWYRLLMLAMAVPVAIAANTLRVILMHMGAYYFGLRWMGTFLHDLPAAFSIPVGMLMFLAIDRLMYKLSFPAPANSEKFANTAEAPPATIRQSWAPSLSASRGLLAGASVLAIGVVLQLALAAQLRGTSELCVPPLTGPLDSLPLAIANPGTGDTIWLGQDAGDSRESLKAKLPFQVDDLLLRGYRNRQGVTAQLYMVYSRAGEDRKHHPEICIRDVSGAPEDLSFRKKVPLSEDGSYAQRFRFQMGTNRSTVVFYWHYAEAPLPDQNRSPLQTLHLRVGMTAPSITVQVTTSADSPEALEAIEKQLLPSLDLAAHQRVLPAGTETGCNRLPIGLIRQP